MLLLHLALRTPLFRGSQSLAGFFAASSFRLLNSRLPAGQSLLLFVYTHSLGKDIPIHGFKYLHCADNSQMCIFSMDLPPEHQTHLSSAYLTDTLGCVKHLYLDISQNLFISNTPPTSLKPKTKQKCLSHSLTHLRK